MESHSAFPAHQMSLRRSLRCSAAAADAAAPEAAASTNGALSRIIDTELRAEAEQSYLAVCCSACLAIIPAKMLHGRVFACFKGIGAMSGQRAV